MQRDQWNGGGDRPPPFRRSYKHKCPICGVGFGSKARVGEHLENVHLIFPTDGIYRIPKEAPHDLR